MDEKVLVTNLLDMDDQEMLVIALGEAGGKLSSPSDALAILIRKLVSQPNARLRVHGVKLSKIQLEPLEFQKLLLHYLQDPDPTARAEILQQLDSSTSPELIARFFSDESTEVQISAIKAYCRLSKDQSHAFQRISFLLFSNDRRAIVEWLKAMSTLQPEQYLVYSAWESKTLNIPKNEMFFTGCFLRTLESEFYEVRIETINTISQLLTCVDRVYPIVKILLDVINDEYIEVRIRVLELLATLTSHFRLKKQVDVESWLFNLTDTNLELRSRVYDLFQAVKVDSANHLLLVLNALFNNLETYPQDKDYIFSVCAKLGQNNRRLTSEACTNLLEIDTRFLAIQKNWKDIGFSARLIFLENAGAKIPDVYQNHVMYLKDCYGTLFVEDASAKTTEPLELTNLKALVAKIQKNPIKHLLDAKTYSSYLLKTTLTLQHRYLVPGQGLVNVRLLGHLLQVLYLAATEITGAQVDIDYYQWALDNLRKNAAVLKNHHLVALCESEGTYSAFVPGLVHMIKSLDTELEADWTEPDCEVVFPETEATVHKFGCMQVSGHGNATHCLARLPNGTTSIVPVTEHLGHLYSDLRVVPPLTRYEVEVWFAKEVAGPDIFSGSGTHQTPLEYVPISHPRMLFVHP